MSTRSQPSPDTTQADQQAELDRQAHIAAEMERAQREELPLLGGDHANEPPPWAVPA